MTTPLTDALAGLGAARLRVTFHAETPLDLGPFAGFPLYGALKQHTMRAGCLAAKPCLDGCVQPDTCPYGHLFETAAPPDRTEGGRYRDAPKPVVLHLAEPARTAWAAGDRLRFEVVLVGAAAARAVPALGEALRAVEQYGLGGEGPPGQVSLAALEVVLPDGMPQPLGSAAGVPLHPLAALAPEPDGARLALHFESPLRLRRAGRWLNEDDLSVEHLAEALVRQLDLLARFHGDGPLGPDTEPLLDAARRVTVVQRRLRWTRRDRRSGRHARPIPMDGVTGHLLLEGVAPDLTRLLALGALVHAGSKTTQGLGQVRLVPLT